MISRTLRHVAAITISAAAALATASLAASAATHVTQHFTYPDTLCGFSGTSSWDIVDNFGDLHSGASFDAGRLVQTFTLDSGRGVVIYWDTGHVYNEPPAQNADGTTSLVSIFSGSNARVQALKGAVLETGEGRVQVTVTLDQSGNLVSITAESLAGQNPNLSGLPDCGVIGPHLAG